MVCAQDAVDGEQRVARSEPGLGSATVVDHGDDPDARAILPPGARASATGGPLLPAMR